MKRFNDATGKQWEIDVHLGSIEKVKSLCGVDLTKLFEADMVLLGRLFDDAKTLVDVLACLCGKENDPDFLTVFRGDSLEEAAKALTEDVIDFFPNAKRRELCRSMLRKVWEITETQQAELSEAIESLPTSSNCATNLGVSSD